MSESKWGRRTEPMFALADQAVVSGTRFLTTVMVTRFCGASELGVYSLGFTVLVLFDVIQYSFLSLPYTVFAKRFSDHRHDQYLVNASPVLLLICVLCSLFFAGLAFLCEVGARLETAMLSLCAVGWVSVVREFARRQCFAVGRQRLAFALDVVVMLVQLPGLYALFYLASLDAVSAHLIANASALAAVSVWAIVNRHHFSRATFSCIRALSLARKHWRLGRWQFLSQVTNQLSWNAVHWFLAIKLGTDATGTYAGCLTIVFLSNPLVLGIANWVLPHLTQLYDQQGYDAMHRATLKASVGLGTTLAIGTVIIFFFGQFFCEILFDDPNYENVTALLTTLMLAVSCLAITMPIEAALCVMQRTAIVFVASVIGMAMTIGLLLGFIDLGLNFVGYWLLCGCVAESALRIAGYSLSARTERTTPETPSL